VTPKARKWLEQVRECALSLPETSERLSHGAPSFFIKKTKNFLNFAENHHGDGRIALWAAATLDAQQLLVNAEPKHFFVPAYVGHLGWVGVRLDKGIAFKKVKAIIEQAWRVRAPAKLLSSPDTAPR
jgi:hypothetical protein